MKRIVLTCRCGATATFEDGTGTYVKDGGGPDDRGRVYMIEKWADQWRDEHRAHAMFPSTKEGT